MTPMPKKPVKRHKPTTIKRKQSPYIVNESRTVFGSEVILSEGMSAEEYFQLREKWYRKAQEHGHIEIERYNEYNPSLTSAYMSQNTKKTIHDPLNYSASTYYDHLSTFANHIEYLLTQPTLRESYKINRFFVSMEPTRTNQTSISPVIQLDINRFILDGIILGCTLDGICDYIGRVKELKHASDLDRLQTLTLKPATFKAFKGTNKNRLWQRIRLIHECCWQFLILAGLITAEEAYSMDLLGLDNPVMNQFISSELGIPIVPQSLASRYSTHIY
jgi:hypothetical protein